MTHDPDETEDALAEIDLHAWRVPPPAAVDRSSLLVRALSPATAQPRRPRLAWIMAAIVIVNAVLATLVVILAARAPATQATATVQPAGGGAVDDRVRELVRRLEREQRELERKLAEIRELRALVLELSEKVRRYEQQDHGRERTVPKPRERQAERRGGELVNPFGPPSSDPRGVATPTDPFGTAGDLDSCDEVSCVLMNYEGACCAKYRSPDDPFSATDPSPSELPDVLDRHSITQGIAAVKAQVAACANRTAARGTVKVGVYVGPNGRVTRVSVDATPDAALGACVAAAVQRAVFPRTQHGGSFRYPFVF